MQADVLPHYLDQAALLHRLHLTPAQRAAALLNLERFAAIASTFVDDELDARDEVAFGYKA